jgi:hypothetical protein
MLDRTLSKNPCPDFFNSIKAETEEETYSAVSR